MGDQSGPTPGVRRDQVGLGPGGRVVVDRLEVDLLLQLRRRQVFQIRQITRVSTVGLPISFLDPEKRTCLLLEVRHQVPRKLELGRLGGGEIRARQTKARFLSGGIAHDLARTSCSAIVVRCERLRGTYHDRATSPRCPSVAAHGHPSARIRVHDLDRDL